jgi:hypothetical protein
MPPLYVFVYVCVFVCVCGGGEEWRLYVEKKCYSSTITCELFLFELKIKNSKHVHCHLIMTALQPHLVHPCAMYSQYVAIVHGRQVYYGRPNLANSVITVRATPLRFF